MEKRYYVYILTNNSGTLYIGVSSNAYYRKEQHKEKLHKDSFTAKYNINKLVYYEVYPYVQEAIMREKQLKTWSRAKKLNLIKKKNPKFEEIEVVD